MKIRELSRRFRAAVVSSVGDVVESVAAGINREVPRETGGLAATLEVEHAHPEESAIASSVSIGSREHPAGPVEFGTTEMNSQPFFRPAVNRAEAHFLHSLRNSLN